MTDGAINPDLRWIVSSTYVVSPTAYSIEGQLRDFSNLNVKISVPPGHPDGTPAVVPAMEAEIYGRLYTRTRPEPAVGTSIPELRDHVAALSAANCGRGTWESGWKVEGVEADGRVRVAREGIAFWVPRNGLRSRRRNLRPGDACQVLIGKEIRQLVPGFYVAIGDGDPRDRRESKRPQVRLYWHLTAAAAIDYIRTVTRLLNAASIPFRTKVVCDPNLYIRADAGVLYIDKGDFERARPMIRETYAQVRGGLRPETPLFTKSLAPGLGFAEDPRNGLSFGYSRSRLVARALWDAHQSGAADPEQRVEAVAHFFRREGIDPARPHLESGSADIANG
jgi:hypothetical protein